MYVCVYVSNDRVTFSVFFAMIKAHTVSVYECAYNKIGKIHMKNEEIE